MRNWLRDHGVETFLPFVEQSFFARGRQYFRTAPLFFGYLFVNISGIIWQSLLRDAGIGGFLMQGEKPAALSDEMYDDLNMILEDHNDERVLRWKPVTRSLPSWKEGEKLRVVGGTFFGYNVKFLRMRGDERCKVLVRMLGRTTCMDMNLDQLEAV